MNADSLHNYLSTIHHIRDEWDVPGYRELWFRAEDEQHFKTRLQPSLYRARDGGKRKSVSELLLLEGDLYDEFVRCAPQLADLKYEDDEWDPYFLMQHHGVPTRLLDWTDGALIALHFAVRNKSAPIKSGSIIHVLDASWLTDQLKNHSDRRDAQARWNKFNKQHPHDTYEDEWERLYLPIDEDDTKDRLLATPETPLLWDSPHVSRRVAAQRSRFMIFGTDPLWVAKLSNEKHSRLFSIEIGANSIAEIKQDLRDAGITESVVYPDLDGLGRELKQLWDARR